MAKKVHLIIRRSVTACLALACTVTAVLPALPADSAKVTAPRSAAPAKKPRKSKAAPAVAPLPAVSTPPVVVPLSTTRYEEVELVPVPPPTPTPATDLFD